MNKLLLSLLSVTFCCTNYATYKEVNLPPYAEFLKKGAVFLDITGYGDIEKPEYPEIDDKYLNTEPLNDSEWPALPQSNIASQTNPTLYAKILAPIGKSYSFENTDDIDKLVQKADEFAKKNKIQTYGIRKKQLFLYSGITMIIKIKLKPNTVLYTNSSFSLCFL